MPTRVRFAPSPTGHVHIGNVRTAIFNFLFARATNGQFLLRIEDTDRVRSTPEAIDALMAVMQWLALDHDEDPVYQTAQRASHDAAAAQLLAAGNAYRHAKGNGAEAVLFRIPFHCDALPCIRDAGPAEIAVHPDVPVEVDHTGIRFAMVSKKGKPIPTEACLAGFLHLTVHEAGADQPAWHLDDPDAIIRGEESVAIPGATMLRFRRREVFYHDLVKGEIAKPLDSMKDQVIVRSDGNPVFHLANVCDDATQGITHIIRGDDHVENTFRHLLLFHALGHQPPAYAHLPMIVNAQGKPYSKRDGDAFVSDFRDKGYLPDALINYLALLGWSPGDDREKLSRNDLVAAFTLDRVRSAPSQMDIRKLDDLNGQYVADMPADEFFAAAVLLSSSTPLQDHAASPEFPDVAALMQPRTRVLNTDALTDWEPFFIAPTQVDHKPAKKAFKTPGVEAALANLADQLADSAVWHDDAIATAMQATAEANDVPANKFMAPVRLAVTGRGSGADLIPSLRIIGRDAVVARLRFALANWLPEYRPA